MKRGVLWLVVGVAGVALAMLACGGGVLVLTFFLVSRGTLTTVETLFVANIVALGFGFGIPLVLHGWAGWQERPSRPFSPSHVWLLWLALMFLVGLGTVVSSRSLAPALLLPPIHVLAMTLAPLIVLWIVGWALRGMGGSWREVVVSMTGGGFLGLVASLIGEGLVGFALVVGTTAVTLTTPGGEEQIAALARNLQDPAWLRDTTNLKLLLSPAVVISALGMLSIFVPLIEEAFKTLAAGVVACRDRPHPARAFLWGVAAGAGFALAENLFNGALGGVEGWGLGAVTRFGATVMHCFTGGLIGWGWGQLGTARRPLRLLGAYVVGVTIHGLWNAVAVGAAYLSVSAFVREGDKYWLAFADVGTLTLIGLLGMLSVVFLVALPLAGRRLADEAERLQWGSGPLAPEY